MFGKRVEEKDDDKEIEGIEGPAQKAGAHRMPAIGVFSGCFFRQVAHRVRVKVSEDAEGGKGAVGDTLLAVSC